MYRWWAMVVLTVLALAPAHAGGIQWYGTLDSGLEAARQSGRPILLVSGAPACHGVPGVW